METCPTCTTKLTGRAARTAPPASRRCQNCGGVLTGTEPPARRRGRPPRVPGEAASRRLELRLTWSELTALRAFARESGGSVADAVRLAVLGAVADAGEGAIVTGRDIVARISSGRKSGPGAS